MSPSPVSPVPEGMHTLTPHLICAGAVDAMAFYARAFGATELGRLAGPDGRLMHGMMKIGDSALMLVDEMPEWNALGPKALKGTPVTLHLYVNDVDAAMKRAEAAGAKVRMPAAEMFWGDRYGQVEDPFGHVWAIATHTRDLTEAQIRDGMAATVARGEGCGG